MHAPRKTGPIQYSIISCRVADRQYRCNPTHDKTQNRVRHTDLVTPDPIPSLARDAIHDIIVSKIYGLDLLDLYFLHGKKVKNSM